VGASKNVTKDKLFEEELIRNKQRLELALLGGELGLWDYNTKTERFFVNETWKEMFGLQMSDDKIDFRLYVSLVHPDDVRMIMDLFQLFVTGEKSSYEIEYRIKHSNGRWRWILSKGKVAEWDDTGKPLRIIGTNLDITSKNNLNWN